MKRIKLFAVMLAALIIPLAAGLAVASPAYAGGGDIYCYQDNGVNACLNAWGGGPWVKVNTNNHVVNDDFVLHYESGTGEYYLQFEGGGSWNGMCIGDAYNESYQSTTSLDPCPGANGGGGWGTNFYAYSSGCPSGEIAFQNVHWSSKDGTAVYLGPPNNYTNGSIFSLAQNEISGCFAIFPAV